jgi:hypothetical protein
MAIPMNQIVPQSPNRLVRQNAVDECLGMSPEQIKNKLEGYYKQTTAHSLSKRNDPNGNLWTLIAGKNSPSERFSRWKDERYIVVEQNGYELMDKVFTFTLLIFTIVLLIYAFKYELTLVPKSMVITYDYESISKKKEDELNEKEKNIKLKHEELEKYKTIQFVSDVFKGVSAAYVITLGTISLFKRTTY